MKRVLKQLAKVTLAIGGLAFLYSSPAAANPSFCFQNSSQDTFVLGHKLNDAPPRGLLLGEHHNCNEIPSPQDPSHKVTLLLMHSKRHTQEIKMIFDPSCQALNFKIFKKKTGDEATPYSVYMWESDPLNPASTTKYDLLLEKQGEAHILKCK